MAGLTVTAATEFNSGGVLTLNAGVRAGEARRLPLAQLQPATAEDRVAGRGQCFVAAGDFRRRATGAAAPAPVACCARAASAAGGRSRCATRRARGW